MKTRWMTSITTRHGWACGFQAGRSPTSCLSSSGSSTPGSIETRGGTTSLLTAILRVGAYHEDPGLPSAGRMISARDFGSM